MFCQSLIRSRLWFKLTQRSIHGNKVSPRTFKEMPTEKGSSLLWGIAPEMFREDTNKFVFYRSLAKKHGKIFRVKVAPMTYIVITSNPEDVEVIRKKEGKYPSRGGGSDPFRIIMESSKTNSTSHHPLSLTVSEGEQWKNLRSELNPIVIPRKLRRHIKRLDAVSETFLELVQESVDEQGYSRDLMEFIPLWSFEAMSRFLFPQVLNVQRSSDQRYIDTFEGVRAFSNALRVQNYPPFVLKYFPVKTMKLGKAGFEKFNASMLEIIKDMESKGITSSEDPAEGTFLEQWKAQGLSHDRISMNLADFLSASSDTTVNTTALGLCIVAKHPHVQEKAHMEVLSVIGRNGIITEESLHKLTYIKGIQREAARFQSVFPVPFARILDEDVVLGGYHIPAKTIVMLNVAAMGKDPEIFMDPEEFRPERWVRENKNDGKFGKQLIAAEIFGFGPRMCIGRRLAELEMWTLLAKILQKTKLELHPASEDLEPVGSVFQRPDRPLKVKLTPV